MTEKEFFAVERDAALDERYHGTKIIDLFQPEIKKEYPGATITDAGIHHAFVCQLDLLWRQRKFEKRVCKTDPLVPAIPFEELKLWGAIDCNKSGTFEQALEDTCYSEDCKTCHGKGHLECPGCHGAGEESCPECHGHEPHKCPTCHGTGNVRSSCYKCNGTGRIECRDCDGRGSMECRACHGSGLESYFVGSVLRSKTCSHCHGTGGVTCPSCNGARSFVCVKCGGRGGETNTCGECHGTGELHHCSECQDKGVVTCRTCKGHKKLHCKECSDVGHHTWIYYLLQQEWQKTIRSVSIARAWVGDRRTYYEKESEKSDYEKMSFDISDGINILPEKIPETIRLRVMKMWQAAFSGKEFENFDEAKVAVKDELLKIKTDSKNGDWDSRLINGKLVVSKIDTHAYVNIKWKGKTSTLFFEPLRKKIILGGNLRAEKSREDKARARRKSLLVSFAELFVIAGVVYLLGVHYDWFPQQVVRSYLSTGIAYYLSLQIWFGETCPVVYNFWNWPAVLSLMTIAIGIPVMTMKTRSIGSLVGFGAGILAAIVLMVALPFMDGISWWLAVLVDFAALSLFSGFLEKIDKRLKHSFFGYVAECLVYVAIAYVIIHFFV